ncbi:hypothetical protein D3C87_1309300 [compost metagenome]
MWIATPAEATDITGVTTTIKLIVGFAMPPAMHLVEPVVAEAVNLSVAEVATTGKLPAIPAEAKKLFLAELAIQMEIYPVTFALVAH